MPNIVQDPCNCCCCSSILHSRFLRLGYSQTHTHTLSVARCFLVFWLYAWPRSLCPLIFPSVSSSSSSILAGDFPFNSAVLSPHQNDPRFNSSLVSFFSLFCHLPFRFTLTKISIRFGLILLSPHTVSLLVCCQV